MSRWFRFYDDTINDPKTLKLSDRTYRIWVGMLCLASKNNGVLPSFEDMAILLRIKPDKLQPELEKLIEVKLLDHSDIGITPHNWNKRQYKSDVSTERVKRFRNGERNVSRNVSETPPDNRVQNTDTEKKESCAVAPATRTNRSEVFEEFWKVYPKRQGANPRKPALQVFEAAVKQGADPAVIVAGAKACAVADRDKIGTPYIPQAVKWLRDRRWEDYKPPPSEARAFQPPPGAPSDSELRAKYEREAAASNHGAAEPAGNNPEKLCSESPPAREAFGRNGVSDNHARNAGMRGLGEILRPIPGGPSVGFPGSDRGDH